MKRRAEKITEMPNSSCEGCRFYSCDDGTCQVPGGTCVFRSISSVPFHWVGDVLENVGVIEPGWHLFENEDMGV